ncbi:mechanosensitive ion channel domain-containing protein [Niveibacterium sp. COAC-50]|uniref:mechanosensitive ion channel domain-containing protein n=1 Tax=Niveibacterium sp. COAC-50 TaxID=2729384 RepID=UPI001551FA66|nr:mechanosensitive ion channel domain-containing protein [Niveibacterium sp. COAC-50]
MYTRALLAAIALLTTEVIAAPIAGIAGVMDAAGASQSAPAAHSPANPDAMDAASITARMKAAQDALARADNRQAADEALPPGIPPELLSERRYLLQQQVTAYALQLDMIRRAEALKTRAEIISGADVMTPTDELGKPPYSIVLVDRLRQQLQTVALAVDSIEAQQLVVAKEREIVTRDYDAAELSRRQSFEALERNRVAGDLPRLRWLWQFSELRAHSHGARLQALRQQEGVLATELAQTSSAFRELEARVAQTESKVRFNAADREVLLARQAERRTALEGELANARADANALEQSLRQRQQERDEQRDTLVKLRAALDAARNQMKTPGAAGGKDKHSHTVSIAELEAKIARLNDSMTQAQRLLELEQVRAMTAGDKIDILTRLIESQHFQHVFWDLRYAAEQPGATQATTEALRNGVRELTERIKEPSRSLRHELQLTLDQISAMQDRQANATPEEAALIRQTINAMQDRVQLQLRGLTEVGQLRLMATRWSEEFNREAADRSAKARLDAIRNEVVDTVGDIWSYEFTTVSDTAIVDGQTIATQRGVTVGKLVIALITLFAGFWLARRVARLFNNHIHARFGIPLQTLNTASNWVLSGVFAMLFVISLAIVRIPLTVFAFLGGAIAIGAGFGMQTLLKNLMSGLMLLVERPFKLGDTVEVAGKRGTVTDIGVRASTIRNIDGIETLVPNASFIEQEVTNWTYTSGKVRFAVKIGVAYGSPARRVAELLLEVAQRHGKILKDPEPEVLFEDFGADALNFGLYFWLDLDAGTAGRIVTSDVRFMIDKAFAEAGIVIAFPQRDVHLDTSRPLEIRMLDTAAPGSPVAT